MQLELNRITQSVIGAAIEVHRELGPGLLESAYEECLCHELWGSGVAYARQRELPVEYKGLKLDCGYRVDLYRGRASRRRDKGSGGLAAYPRGPATDLSSPGPLARRIAHQLQCGGAE